MLHVVCLNAGNYQGHGRQYVETLFDMVRRNLPAGFAGTFELFTDDDPACYHPDITVRPLPNPELQGWWHKLSLFQPGLFATGDQVIYFDLDTLITGRLDEIAKYEGTFAALRDAYRPDGLQSSVMAWRVGHGSDAIWNWWDSIGRPEVDGGDQAFLERAAIGNWDRLQDKFPGRFASYKQTGGKLPETASVIFFHGIPRPHQVTTGWVPEVWKIGGLMRGELDTIANTTDEKLFANVKRNIARPLAWLDYAKPHDRHVAIVGGGPSAGQHLDELRVRQQAGQRIWALNGAAEWLVDHYIVPDAQIIVDARPETAKLLCPKAKHHYLASQCDPVMFDRVAANRVTVWHSHAPGIEPILEADTTTRPVHLIGGGSTVGISAMVLAEVLGYRQVHLYGYDSSYAPGDRHHAYPQALNDGDLAVDVVAGAHRFRAAPWMVQQAQEFIPLATSQLTKGLTITVHGEGLLPAIAAELMANPPRTPAQQRAEAVLSRLPEGPVTGAEIGVFIGEMSRALLERPDLSLLMVDSWEGAGAGYTGDSGDWHAKLAQTDQERYRGHAEAVAKDAGDRALVVPARSTEAAKNIADGSLDFVFIDADHSYEGAAADIAAWAPKLKPGGLLAGHDYDNPDFPQFGVKRAVDEFIAASGLTLDLGENLTWFARMPHDLSERTRRHG